MLAGHFDLLKMFQPCCAEDPTGHRLAVLRDLSNIDKHRVVHAAAVVPEDFAFEFAESDGVTSHGEIEIFYGQPLKDDAHVGRVHDVVVSRPKPNMDAQGPFTVGVTFDHASLPAVHQQPVATVLGQLEAVADLSRFERI